MHLFRLTRPLNLLIIVLTMWLMRVFVLTPIVAVNGYELQLSSFHFAVLILATVLIAAAGNVINDYFDQRTDRLNKPKHIIVGVHVKRRVAMAVHQVLNLSGLLLAFYVAFSIGFWELSLIHFFAAGTLWFYSTMFKKELIIGNVLIAVLAGLVPLLVGVYEIPLLAKAYGAEVAQYFALNRPGENPVMYFQYMFYFILAYAGFAFILNLIREIQKDMADTTGDREIGAKTIPLVYGIKAAKYINGGLILLSIFLLLYLQQNVVSDIYSLIYLLIGVVLPLLASLIVNALANSRKQFVVSGNLLKLAMLFGILYSIVHYYIYYATSI